MFSAAPLLIAARNKWCNAWVTKCEASKTEVASSWDANWDMKADHNAKSIRQVILIRHGQYVQGVKGDEKRVLTDLGITDVLVEIL